MPNFPHPFYSQTVLQPAYDDAQAYLFDPMLAAHEAHAIMLAECDIITRDNAAAIIEAVAEIRAASVEAMAYQPGIEDLFFRVEGQIIERTGPELGGNLQLARSRNDLGQALTRMALRPRLLALSKQLLKLRDTVHAQATKHLHTLMPGYTHTQPAQPITFAHYLAGLLTFLAADQQRFARAYANVNQSPLGAAALTGTGFPIDRQRVAKLLGFDGLVASTQHAIGAGDHLTDVAFGVQSLAVGLSRVTHDLLVRATRETNALHIDDSFIQISSIMPQKRNPVVLEHLRARLSRALGYAATVVTQCHNIPYGDTQDIEDEILPPLFLALSTLGDCLALYTAFFETLRLNEEHLRERAAAEFTTATELADALVREAGLPFRTAHKVVATMVQRAVSAKASSEKLSVDQLQAAAREVIGGEVDFDAAQFERALDAQHFVDVRNGVGGVAPESTEAVLAGLSEKQEDDAAWLSTQREHLGQADALRADAVHDLLGG